MLHLHTCAVDLEVGIVSGGQPCRLTNQELTLFRFLIDKAPGVVSREELLVGVWNLSPLSQTRRVDMCVRNLRKKIEDDPGDPRHILTVHGEGYRFVPKSTGDAETPALRAVAPLRVGPFFLDVARQQVITDEGRIPLTNQESQVLHCLAERVGQTLRHEDLFATVWGGHLQPGSRVVASTIARLRDKLPGALSIRTVRGEGYRLETPDAQVRGRSAVLVVSPTNALARWTEDPNAMAAAMGALSTTLQQIAGSGGGVVLSGGGDDQVLVMPSLASARECVDTLLARLGSQIQAGMTEGEMLRTDADQRVSGPAVVRATAFCRMASMGQVLTDIKGPSWVDVGLNRVGANMVRLWAMGARATPGGATTTNLSPMPEILTRTDLEMALQDHIEAGERLVSLFGPAGAGKTTLARAVAWKLHKARLFPGGVWFIDLRPDKVVGDIVRRIRVVLELTPASDPTEHLLANLHKRPPSLIVLDNLEHLTTQARPLLKTLLETPIQWMVTTREALATGEVVLDVDRLTIDEGLRLMRWVAEQQGAPMDASGEDMALLIERLEGNPLAIHHAAARLDVLSVTEQLDRISGDRRSPRDIRAPLWNALDRSWSLLGEDEKATLKALTLFVGGGAPAEIAALGGNHLATLPGLVTKSMVLSRDGRFTMLVAVQSYVQGHLSTEEEQQAQNGHFRVFSKQGAAMAARFEGLHWREAHRWALAERDNMTALLGRLEDMVPIDAVDAVPGIRFVLQQTESDLTQAAAVERQLVGLAEEAENEEQTLRGIIELAWVESRIGTRDQGLARLDAIAERARVQGGPVWGTWCGARAFSLAKLGRDQEAIESAEEGLQTAPLPIQARLRTLIATLLLRRFEDGKAHEQALGALSLAAQRPEQSQAHGAAIGVFLSTGRLEEGRRAVASLEGLMARGEVTPRDRSSVLSTLSMACASLGEEERAMAHAHALYQHASVAADRLHKRRAAMFIAQTELMEGRLEQSQRWFDRAHPNQSLGSWSDLSLEALRVALLLFQEDNDAAIERATKALGEAQALGLGLQEVILKTVLAVALTLAGSTKEAEPLLESALEQAPPDLAEEVAIWATWHPSFPGEPGIQPGNDRVSRMVTALAVHLDR